MTTRWMTNVPVSQTEGDEASVLLCGKCYDKEDPAWILIHGPFREMTPEEVASEAGCLDCEECGAADTLGAHLRNLLLMRRPGIMSTSQLAVATEMPYKEVKEALEKLRADGHIVNVGIYTWRID